MGERMAWRNENGSTGEILPGGEYRGGMATNQPSPSFMHALKAAAKSWETKVNRPNGL